jgi:hypothetical protein
MAQTPRDEVLAAPACMTFGTAKDAAWRVAFTPMASIATITSLAAMTCGLVLVGLLWREAERADQAIETLMQRRRTSECTQK